MRRTRILSMRLTVIGISCCVLAISIRADDWIDLIKTELGGQTITCAFAPHPTTTAFQTMVKEFTALTGLTVRWDIIEENLLRQKLLADHEARTGLYDVLLIDAFNMSEYAPTGLAIDLEPLLKNPALTPDWFNYEDILPAYRNGIGTYRGVIYGIPVAGETRYVGYRKDLLQRYGQQPPETMAELLALAKFFQGKEPGLYGISMRGQRGIHFASGWMTTMYQNGGQFLDQQTWQVLVNQSQTVASLAYYVELLHHGPPEIGDYTHQGAVEAFMAGKTALWFDSTAWTSTILDQTRSQIVEQVGFVPPPVGPAGAYGALAGWNVGISSDIPENRQKAAWAFIVWMTSQRNAEAYVKSGGTPVRKSVYTNPALIAEDWTFPIQLKALERAANLVKAGITWIPPHVKTMQVIEVMGDAGAEVFAGHISVQDALDQAQKEVERIMAK